MSINGQLLGLSCLEGTPTAATQTSCSARNRKEMLVYLEGTLGLDVLVSTSRLGLELLILLDPWDT